MEESFSIGQNQWPARIRVKPFIMNNDVLYKMGQDNKIEGVFVNHRSSACDEGVTWGNNKGALHN